MRSGGESTCACSCRSRPRRSRAPRPSTGSRTCARDADETEQSSRVAILLVDGARAFLINFLPDDDNLYAGKDIGVFTDQEAMVAALGTLVEPRWRESPTIAEVRASQGSAIPQVRARDLGLGVLFDETRDAVIVADESGAIRLWNHGATHALGYTAQEATVLRVRDILPDHVASFLDVARGLRADLATGMVQRRDGVHVELEGAFFQAVSPGGSRAFGVAVLRPPAPGAQRSLDIRDAPPSQASPRGGRSA